ncbi:MAG: nickel pincer cofactor biosynthesis protein LarB [Verrucomicrobiaceae bacterium]|nr:MAG: nickel pincer cofactor biosynthesis protein LarB [Verrucomicrobiaceae bacterium]
MAPEFVRVDVGRADRCGRPETIFCEGKLPGEVAEMAGVLRRAGQPVLATRGTAAHFDAVAEIFPEAVWHGRARCITIGAAAPSKSGFSVGIVCAGTSDLPVADEAAVTLEAFGQKVERVTDVGVAGLHRLLGEIDRLRACGVLVVVAGMEGALPSVVAGLVERPVIAVPTSIGYGANLGGIAALLGMLTSCAAKVTVVNIDNGFGAACAADAILRLAEEKA